MNAADIASALEEALPDSKIIADLRQIFEECGNGETVSIELNVGWVPMPVDARVEMVAKRFNYERQPGVCFGTYRITVAIGGFQPDACGSHKAGFCFADMFYNEDGLLVTQDFYEDYLRLPIEEDFKSKNK